MSSENQDELKAQKRQIVLDIIHQVEQQKQTFQSFAFNKSTNTCECRIACFKTFNKKKVPYLAWLPSLNSFYNLSKANKEDFIKIQEEFKDQKDVLLKSVIILSNQQIDILLDILLSSYNSTAKKTLITFEQASQQAQTEIEPLINSNTQHLNTFQQVQQQSQTEIESLSNRNTQTQITIEQAQQQAQTQIQQINDTNSQNLIVIEQAQQAQTIKQNLNLVKQNQCSQDKIEIQHSIENTNLNLNINEQAKQQDNEIQIEQSVELAQNLDLQINVNKNFSQALPQIQQQNVQNNELKQIINYQSLESLQQKLIMYQNNEFLKSYNQQLTLTSFHQIEQNKQNQIQPQQKLKGKWSKKNKKNRLKQKQKNKSQNNNYHNFNILQEETDNNQKQEFN